MAYTLPITIREILDPYSYKRSLGLIDIATPKKTRDELLDEFLKAVKFDVTKLNINNFAEIMPIFPSIESPDLRVAVVFGQKIKPLSVNPYVIIKIIWDTAIKFTMFSNLDPELIPELVYQNLFEGAPILVLPDIHYIAVHSDLKSWVIKLFNWYSSNGKMGMKELFDAKSVDNATYDTFLNLAIYMICAYNVAVTAYASTDLVDFWNQTVEERQAVVFQFDPKIPAMRFTYKYKNIYSSGEQIISTQPPRPAAIQKNQREELLEIYYEYQIQIMFTELKKIIACQALSQELNEDLGHRDRFDRWIERSVDIVTSIKRDLKLKKTDWLYLLRSRLKKINKSLAAYNLFLCSLLLWFLQVICLLCLLSLLLLLCLLWLTFLLWLTLLLWLLWLLFILL